MSIVADPTDPTTDPTDPTPPSGSGGTGGGTGGGGSTTPTTTVAGVNDVYHGQGVEICLFDNSGNRRRLPALDISDARWTIEPMGGYADFTLTLHAEPTDLTNIVAGNMVEIWDFGIRQYRGYVGDLTRSEDEPPTLALSGYGRIIDLQRMVLVGNYQRATETDLSDFFSEIGTDIQARYPDVVVSTDYIGVGTQVIEGRAKTAKDALDALIGLASSVAVYGFDVDDSGRDRLYLRKIDTTVPGATIAIPGPNVGKRECALRVSDVVNVVTVVGGTPDFPQLLPNGSFEQLTLGGEAGDYSAGDNLIRNGSFEGIDFDGVGAGDDWSFDNGASLKKNGGQEPPARTGNWSAELDHTSEKIVQISDTPPIAVVAGHTYEVGAWVRPEFSADFIDPPVVTLRFCWRSGGSDQTITSWTYTVSEATYREAYQTFVAPSGATGIHLEVELTHLNGSGGHNNGVMVDDLYCIDVNALTATQWAIVPHGSASVNAINWQGRNAYDGRNCLFLDVNSSDADNEDVHIRILPYLELPIVGGTTMRLSVRVKSFGAAAIPKLLLVQQYHEEDGTLTGGTSDNSINEYRSVIASAVVTDWTYISYDVAAPGNATKGEYWINIRGTGQLYVDAISLRQVPDMGDESMTDTSYLPTGNLQTTYRADDLVTAAEDAEVNGSIATYGLREKVENAGGITTLTDARAWAKSYLLANAIAYPAPVIDLYDDPRQWRVGQSVRLTGRYGAVYADRVLPLMRINGTIDSTGLLTHSLEIGRTRPTDDELIARLSLANAYRARS